MEEGKYLVWSNEHNAWWTSAKRGYTVSIDKAGRYSLDEAIQICNGANSNWSKGSTLPDELPIAEEAALRLNEPKENDRKRFK